MTCSCGHDRSEHVNDRFDCLFIVSEFGGKDIFCECRAFKVLGEQMPESLWA